VRVVELRQYQLHPGRREELIELFETHLIEPQERCGMTVLGQFRDLDRPDWFVWLRGFADMADRTRALRAFYEGPVWAQHREAANATMVDSDNVLLLRPVGRAPRWAWPEHVEVVVARDPVSDDGELLALLETEPAPNGFPALPVREGESLVVSIRTQAAPAPRDPEQILRLAPTEVTLRRAAGRPGPR
jgi:NIPSNAP